jgi:hypothetical protein
VYGPVDAVQEFRDRAGEVDEQITVKPFVEVLERTAAGVIKFWGNFLVTVKNWDDLDGQNLLRSISLRDEEYCRGGWVALEDVVDACVAALQTMRNKRSTIYRE